MRERLSPILAPYRRQRGALIPVLQKVQEELGYLPEEAVSEIAFFLGLSESEVYGVASFYAQFRFERQGEHTVKVCQGTACYVRGGRRILELVKRELGIEPGETTEDYGFSLERIACFGSCALAPVMVVNKTVYGRMTTAKARKTLALYRREPQVDG
ncbi:MAG TPA: NADH-quinone oxidoreductase subunit NuoE [Dehalococcoidia bacterium]|nr:NADH-quinone oxidoreductase subunit NuoE [Dehalococcoidia bacterium]